MDSQSRRRGFSARFNFSSKQQHWALCCSLCQILHRRFACKRAKGSIREILYLLLSMGANFGYKPQELFTAMRQWWRQ
ncbi:hypothetical protein U9M48_037497 [Paspalum notatum var. saurae]|uniref:Uncharacterized protein n=1 Tax=Paspalum notatum var. saurae TaxID=547442 RepID=A0AAQ3UF15_PASNO